MGLRHGDWGISPTEDDVEMESAMTIFESPADLFRVVDKQVSMVRSIEVLSVWYNRANDYFNPHGCKCRKGAKTTQAVLTGYSELPNSLTTEDRQTLLKTIGPCTFRLNGVEIGRIE